MTDNNVLNVVPGKSDADVAADIKAAMLEALKPVCKAIDDAKTKGFVVTFNLGPDYAGHHVVALLTVAKHF